MKSTNKRDIREDEQRAGYKVWGWRTVLFPPFEARRCSATDM